MYMFREIDFTCLNIVMYIDGRRETSETVLSFDRTITEREIGAVHRML